MAAYTLLSINIFLLPGIVSEVISLQYMPWVMISAKKAKASTMFTK